MNMEIQDNCTDMEKSEVYKPSANGYAHIKASKFLSGYDTTCIGTSAKKSDDTDQSMSIATSEENIALGIESNCQNTDSDRLTNSDAGWYIQESIDEINELLNK